MTAALDLTASSARTERDQLAGRTDVLDKVGALQCLPDNTHCTSPMVAKFFEVTPEVIRQTVLRNREELDDDGYEVLTRSEVSDKLSLTPDELGMPRNAPNLSLFPRRAVLRIGMLLRDSGVARRVRDYLLNAERHTTTPVLTDDELIHRALEVSAKRIEALKEKVAELEPKADLAENYLTAQGGARLVRQVAKTFGIKEHELRQFLLDQKLIFARHSPCGETQYEQYADFAHYFQPVEHIVNHRWGSCTHYTLTILPRGVELLHRRLRANGVIA